MGILSFAKKQFIDILQWTEDGDELLAWRFPTARHGDPAGRPAHGARDADGALRGPGHVGRPLRPRPATRSRPQNLPVLTDLRPTGASCFESPFKSEVYFFSTRLRASARPGAPRTRSPSATASSARCACAPSASTRYRIADAARLLPEHLGHARDLRGGRARGPAPQHADHHADRPTSARASVPFLDMAANQVDAGARGGCRRRARPFADLGLALESFQIQNVSLPDELQKRLDERIGMGDRGRPVALYPVPGGPVHSHRGGGSRAGAAGAGAGLGAGIAMGQAMSQGIGQAGGQRATRPGTPAARRQLRAAATSRRPRRRGGQRLPALPDAARPAQQVLPRVRGAAGLACSGAAASA